MKLLLFTFCCLITLNALSQQSIEQHIATLTLKINTYPDSLQNYIERGEAYMKKYEPHNALPDFSKVLYIEKNNPEALKLRSNAYYFLEKYDSSLADIEQFLKSNATDADVWNRRGLNHYWQNKLDTAIGDFNKSLALDPHHLSAWYNRGNTFYWQSKFPQAIADFTQYIFFDTNSISAYYHRGMCYYYSKNYQNAIKDFTKTIEIDSLNDNALNARGICYTLLRNFNAALMDLSLTIKINPINLNAWNSRGNLYKNMGKYQLALSDYTQAILGDPKNIDALYNRGGMFLKMMQPQKALADFNAALLLDPNFSEALYNRADTYTLLGKYESALEDYNFLLKTTPENTDILTSRAICFSKMGNKDLAIKDFNRALSINPDSFFTLMQRGDFYNNQLEYDKAISDYSKAILVDPKAQEPRNNRANIFFVQKNYDLAASDYSVALQYFPDNVALLSNRAYVYKFQKKYDLAKADFYKALTLDPTSAVSWSKLGSVYQETVQFDSAIICFKIALKLDPAAASNYNNLGSIYSNQSKNDRALESFNKALELDPNLVPALNNRGLYFYKTAKINEAIADFRKGLIIEPGNSFLHVNLILVYLATDQFKSAATVYSNYKQKKLTSYIDEFPAWNFLKNYIIACCEHIERKDYENARLLLNHSLEDYQDVNSSTNPGLSINIEYTNVLSKLAFVNEQLGNKEKALEFYKKAFVIYPEANGLSARIDAISVELKKASYDGKIPVEINLLTPKISRGNSVEASDGLSLFVSATIKDNGGVSWVKINGKDAVIQPGGYISASIEGKMNSFTIQAANKNGVISSQTYEIERGAKTTNEMNIPVIPPTERPGFHAVLIACSDYNGSKWKPLPTTLDEAKAYKNVLIEKYGFAKENIVEVYNKDRREILNILSSKMQSLTPNDNIIILFAGHGTYIKREGSEAIGYWVPLNAETQVDYISNGNLSEIIYACKAKHVLMLSDACYSAAMRGSDEDAVDRLTARDEWQFKSRQILTSGGLEKVPGESIFIKMVIKSLKLNEEKIFSVKTLYNQIYLGVKNQTEREPELNVFGKDGNEGGQFYFIKKN
ncbi:MAG: tetratricopeptide repeat protein [Ginsengibacter sp.]